MRSLTRCAALLCLLAGLPPSLAAEHVVYTIRASEQGKGGDSGTRTDVFAVDAEDGQRRRVFSDEALPMVIVISQGGIDSAVIAQDAHLVGVARQRRPQGGSFDVHAEGIYALSTDGTNQLERLLEPRVEQGLSRNHVLLSRSGSRVAFLAGGVDGSYLQVYDAASGERRHKVRMDEAFLGCYASTIGWMPDESTIYLTLDTGDVHVTPADAYHHAGRYLLQADGTGFVRLPPLQPPARAWMWEPQILGALPQGQLVVHGEDRTGRWLETVRPESSHGPRTPLPQQATWVTLAPSGTAAACATIEYDWQAKVQTTRFWVVCLGTGSARVVATESRGMNEWRSVALVGWLRD